MSTVKSKDVEMVPTTCGCGSVFLQPLGAVTVRVCAACLTVLAARFWATMEV